MQAVYEREITIKSEEELVESKLQELAAKLVLLDDREIRLAEREKQQSKKEALWMEREKEMLENAKQLLSLVHVCVGGQTFIIPKSILLKFEGSYFESMLMSKHAHKLPNGEYFINRNPMHFQLLLDYLRTGQVADLSKGDDTDALKEEFKYFKIPLPSKLDTHPLKRIIPLSVSCDSTEIQMFDGGALLSPSSQNIFCTWFPKCAFPLVYRASRDGFKARDFHDSCDKVGPTITVIQSTEGYLFGGYSPVSWNSSEIWATHPQCFLFTLTNPHAFPATIYPLKPTSKGILCHSGYSAVFGSTDICLFSDSHKNDHSYISFPTSYEDSSGKGCFTFTGSQSFSTLDIEVYSVINL